MPSLLLGFPSRCDCSSSSIASSDICGAKLLVVVLASSAMHSGCIVFIGTLGDRWVSWFAASRGGACGGVDGCVGGVSVTFKPRRWITACRRAMSCSAPASRPITCGRGIGPVEEPVRHRHRRKKPVRHRKSLGLTYLRSGKKKQR